MGKIKFFDATLRDGSHAIAHQLTEQNIVDYCKAIDDVGVYTTIVGHGNGLGASSLQVGLSKLDDQTMLTLARDHLRQTKLGIYLIPGFGTIREHIQPAIDIGVDLFKVGCHCTEADTTQEHIEFLASRHHEVYGILMMYHMASTEKLLEESRKMQSYGAKGVIIMDSAGASTPELVKRTISTLAENLDVEVGFHAHNNLGIAVSNSYIAIKSGATIMDGTVRGFGAGAGNCQLEALLALLQMEEIDCDVDLFRMMDVSEHIVKHFKAADNGLDDISIVNGMAGTFSAFKNHVIKASAEFEIDPREILLELGRRKVVGGQEDMIVEVAKELSDNKKSTNDAYYLSSLL